MKIKMPFGFKVIFILVIAGLIWQTVDIIKGNYFKSSAYGFNLPEPINLLMSLFLVVVDLLIVIALIKRYSWGWKLFLLSGGVRIFLSLLAWYKAVNDYPGTFSVIVTTIIYVFFDSIVGLISWYVYRNRKYFNQ